MLYNLIFSRLKQRRTCNLALWIWFSKLLVTESQKGWGWKRPLGVIKSNIPAQAGSPRACCSGFCPYSSCITSGKETPWTTSLDNLLWCSVTLTIKQLFMLIVISIGPYWSTCLKSNPSHTFLKLLTYGMLSFVPKGRHCEFFVTKKISDDPLYCYILSQTELLESFRMRHDLLCKFSWAAFIFFWADLVEQFPTQTLVSTFGINHYVPLPHFSSRQNRCILFQRFFRPEVFNLFP